MNNQFISVYVTHNNKRQAILMARTLVEEKLIACANIIEGNISIYEWQGKVETENEVILFLKSKSELFDDIKKRVLELHPYECPCVLSFNINEGNRNYLDWIKNQTL